MCIFWTTKKYREHIFSYTINGDETELSYVNRKSKQQFMQWYSNSPKAKIFKQIQSAHKIHGHCFLGATIIVDIVSGQIQKCVLLAKTVASVEECIYMTSGHTP